jgi:sugar phosphate permease
VPTTTAGLLAYNVGAMSGPAAAGFAMQQFGPSGLYLFIAAVAIVAAISSMADTTKSRCCPEQISRISVAS